MSTKKQRQRTIATTFITAGTLLALLVGFLGVGISKAANLASIIENTAIGTDVGQVQYTGDDWTICGGCGVDTGNDSYTYGYTVGSSFTLRFIGNQVQIWGVKESAGGIASVTLDGTDIGTLDNYSATKTSTIIYDTGEIEEGTHTLLVTIIGQDDQSSGPVVSFDKADIFSANATSTPTPAPTPPPDPQSLGINAGGAAVDGYLADAYFDQGTQHSDTHASISTNGVTNPAPQAVYQSYHTAANSFTYTIPGLTAGASYTVRLHWAELDQHGVGKRTFNVAINGKKVLSKFDVFATGGYKKAVVKSFDATADASGQIVIAFTHVRGNNPFISGIELLWNKPGTLTNPLGPTKPKGAKAPGLSGAGTFDPYAFGEFRGTPVQVWETWNNFSTWDQMESVPPLDLYFTGVADAPFNVRWPGKISVGQPLWAAGETADNCASGGDDQHYRNVALTLKNAGYGDAFIRLGWEQNGDWFWWHATSSTAAQWVQCFRHAYDAFKSVSRNFVIAWNPNKSTDMPGFDTRTTYPGDDKVDVIAVDYYDMFPPYPTDIAWDANYYTTESGGSPVGLGAYIDFASSHRKPIAFPEWGINTNNSTDNPLFINKMADTFAALRAVGQLYWESLFNLEGCTFQVTDGCNPNASAAYVARF